MCISSMCLIALEASRISGESFRDSKIVAAKEYADGVLVAYFVGKFVHGRSRKISRKLSASGRGP
jgi:hypothetical protein